MEDTELPLSVDAWNRIFQSTSNLISKKNPKQKYKDFGITLAGTHPQDVLPPEDFFDSKILESPIACALGGAYNYYGCIWVGDSDTVIDWKKEQILPTALWQLFPIKHRNLAKAFTADEIFNESPSSLHCIESSMAVKMKIKDRDDPEAWKAKIQKATHSTGQVHLGHGTIKDALMRIAKTHPSVFGQDQIVDESKLIRSSMTALWTATYRILGGLWCDTQQSASLQAAEASIPPRPDLVKIVEGRESRPKKTSFDKDTKPPAKDTKVKATTTTTSKRSTFLSKMPAKNIVKLHKGPSIRPFLKSSTLVSKTLMDLRPKRNLSTP
jgi:hypothetical protein